MSQTRARPVTPFAIASLRDEWLPAIFGRFDEVAVAAAAPLKDDSHWARQAKGRFFLSLAERFDADRYGALQAIHLRPEVVGADGNRLKYFDTPTWSGGKFDHALRLGLHKAAPMRILDLGAGPGHFQLVAEFFGHETLGLDIPLKSPASGVERHLYDDLCDFFAVGKIDCRIMARTALPRLPGRFNLVTSFMTCFSADAKARAPWSVADWTFLLKDLRDNVLAEGGSLYLNLTPGVYDEASWAFLKGVGGEVIEKSRTVSIARSALEHL
ncbi:MAG: class I SAM-dependent methyltransferase [Pseudomonadota bacterium]|nr:class I SAM-dependent methyltransferase [Pseudomonadota bacterium]